MLNDTQFEKTESHDIPKETQRIGLTKNKKD